MPTPHARPLRELAAAGLVLAALAAPAPAQDDGAADAMMEAWQQAMTPGPEHARLAGLAGTWTMTMTVEDPDGGAPEVSVGTAERSMDMDGRVLTERLSTEMMGMPLSGLALTGYDNVTQRYWSTWTDNMSTSITLLWGTWDEEGGVFEGEYSEPIAGTRAPMRIEIAMEGSDRQVDTFYMQGPDGVMSKSMEVVYERQ